MSSDKDWSEAIKASIENVENLVACVPNSTCQNAQPPDYLPTSSRSPGSSPQASPDSQQSQLPGFCSSSQQDQHVSNSYSCGQPLNTSQSMDAASSSEKTVREQEPQFHNSHLTQQLSNKMASSRMSDSNSNSTSFLKATGSQQEFSLRGQAQGQGATVNCSPGDKTSPPTASSFPSRPSHPQNQSTDHQVRYSSPQQPLQPRPPINSPPYPQQTKMTLPPRPQIRHNIPRQAQSHPSFLGGRQPHNLPQQHKQFQQQQRPFHSGPSAGVANVYQNKSMPSPGFPNPALRPQRVPSTGQSSQAQIARPVNQNQTFTSMGMAGQTMQPPTVKRNDFSDVNRMPQQQGHLQRFSNPHQQGGSHQKQDAESNEGMPQGPGMNPQGFEDESMFYDEDYDEEEEEDMDEDEMEYEGYQERFVGYGYPSSDSDELSEEESALLEELRCCDDDARYEEIVGRLREKGVDPEEIDEMLMHSNYPEEMYPDEEEDEEYDEDGDEDGDEEGAVSSSSQGQTPYMRNQIRPHGQPFPPGGQNQSRVYPATPGGLNQTMPGMHGQQVTSISTGGFSHQGISHGSSALSPEGINKQARTTGPLTHSPQKGLDSCPLFSSQTGAVHEEGQPFQKQQQPGLKLLGQENVQRKVSQGLAGEASQTPSQASGWQPLHNIVRAQTHFRPGDPSPKSIAQPGSSQAARPSMINRPPYPHNRIQGQMGTPRSQSSPQSSTSGAVVRPVQHLTLMNNNQTTTLPGQGGQNQTLSVQGGQNQALLGQGVQNQTLPLQGGQNQTSLPGQGVQNQTLPIQGGQNQISLPGQNQTLPGQGGQNQTTLPGQGGQNQTTLPGQGVQNQTTLPGHGVQNQTTLTGQIRQNLSTLPGQMGQSQALNIRQTASTQQLVNNSATNNQQSAFAGLQFQTPPGVRPACPRTSLQVNQKPPEQQGVSENLVQASGQTQAVHRPTTPSSQGNQQQMIHTPRLKAALDKGTAPSEASLARLNVMYMQQSLDQEIMAKKGTHSAQGQGPVPQSPNTQTLNRFPSSQIMNQFPQASSGPACPFQKPQNQTFPAYQPKHQLPPRQPIPAIVNPNSSTNQTPSGGRPICSVVPFTSQNRAQTVSTGTPRPNTPQQNTLNRPRNPAPLPPQNVVSGSQQPPVVLQNRINVPPPVSNSTSPAPTNQNLPVSRGLPQGNTASLVPNQTAPQQSVSEQVHEQQTQNSTHRSDSISLDNLSEDKCIITGKGKQQGLTVNMVYQIRSPKDNTLILALWNGERFEDLKQSDMRALGQSGQMTQSGPQAGVMTQSGPQSTQITPGGPQSGQMTLSGPQSGQMTQSGPQSGPVTQSGLQSGQMTQSGPQAGLMTPCGPQPTQMTASGPQSAQITPGGPQSGQITPGGPQSGQMTSSGFQAGQRLMPSSQRAQASQGQISEFERKEACSAVSSKFQAEFMQSLTRRYDEEEQGFAGSDCGPGFDTSNELGQTSDIRMHKNTADASSCQSTYVKPLPQGQSQQKMEQDEEEDGDFIFKKPFSENEDHFRVCQYCGYTSKNFKRCEGCKRIFQGEVKIHVLKKQVSKMSASPGHNAMHSRHVGPTLKKDFDILQETSGQEFSDVLYNEISVQRGRGRGARGRSGRTRGGGLRGRMAAKGTPGENLESSDSDESFIDRKRNSDGSESGSDGSVKRRPARPKSKNPTPRKRSKKSDEPVTVTISSDEDEPSSTSNNLAGHPPSPAHSAGSESPIFPSMSAEPVNAFGRFRRALMQDEDGNSKLSKTIQQHSVTPQMGRHEEDEDEEDDDDEDGDNPPTYEIDIRSVRIGSMRTQPEGPLLINLHGVCFKVRSERTEEPFECEILAQEVEHVKFFSGQTQPVLFLFLTPECGENLRVICHMEPGDDEYFDPSSTDMKQKMIVIIIECFNYMPHEMLRETLSLWADVNHMEDDTYIEELTEESANDLLIQSAPPVLTADVEKDIVKFKRRYLRDANMPPGPRIPGSPSDSTDNEPDSTSSSPPEVKHYFGSSVRLLQYPPPPARGIPITTEDLFCLTEGEFLNDVIIDFYLQYLYQEKLTEENKRRTHIFSSFFYKRLTQRDRHSEKTEEEAKKSVSERRHARVKKWTKTVDLFSKDFIVVPINEHSHWYLAVICFPGLANSEVVPFIPNVAHKEDLDEETTENGEEKTTEESGSQDSLPRTILGQQLNAKQCLDNEDSKYNIGQKQPCILMFDSLAGPSRNPNIKMLKEYLQCEWNVKKLEPRNIAKILRGSTPKVPQQSNYSDCGVYLLQYVESFFEDPIADFQIPMKGLQNWFSEELVQNKRRDIHELIMSLHRRYQEERGDPQILDIKFESTPRELPMKFPNNQEMHSRSEEAMFPGYSRDDESSNSSFSGDMGRSEMGQAAMGMENMNRAEMGQAGMESNNFLRAQGQLSHHSGFEGHNDEEEKGGTKDQASNESENNAEKLKS